ncbi:hypothetical protein [Desulforhopalus singaporensis]|uniref:Nickel transport protein n=1 Tax=Desulforhopalus singaporensis TaxID=91360 RepID=A0A1H0KSR2_9BACT|nr:hypothetical protein [Desulforhopalus singaporensis]SDO58895.1 nickel transport protein [Desulforhopalus singaporensis]
MKNKTNLLLFFFTIWCVLSATVSAEAHKIRVFAWDEADEVYTEAKFSGGRGAQNAAVTVINRQTGQPVVTGKTDSEGLFMFSRSLLTGSGATEFDIVVSSGDGHKNSWAYSLTAVDDTVAPAAPPVAALQKSTSAPPSPDSNGNSGVCRELTAAELDLILEKKLAPIRRSLAQQSEQGPSLQDILGGIGYILGIAGIAAYMKSSGKK